MKITDILKLAMKNLTGHKRIMLRVAVSVLTVVRCVALRLFLCRQLPMNYRIYSTSI